MQFILEIILEAIVLILFSIPGAFIRWIFMRRKRSYKQVLLDDDGGNVAVGVVVTVIAMAILAIVDNWKSCNV